VIAVELASQSLEVLGSVVQIQLPASQSSLFPICFSELQRIEKTYSRFLADSQLSKLNSRLGEWQDASPELLYLLQQADEFHKKTDGHFDICLKELLEGMGYGPKDAERKNKQPITHPASEQRFFVDSKNSKVLLNRQIEFGGFGKGFALDQVAALLDKANVSHYCINAGGDIFARQGKGEEAWQILLEHPEDPSKAIGSVKIDGVALAASAANRRKWGDKHHLINAKTGKPSQGVKAIFLVAATGIEADAYATAIFTAGFESGIPLASKLPVQMLLVSSENKMYKTPDFAAEFFQ